MTSSAQTDRAALALREAFDRSFAESVGGERPAQLDFLAIRIAGDPYALRLSEVQSLHAECKVVSGPSALPELLGLSGFRGTLTPIYDLAQLLGSAPEPSARWVVVVRHASPIGLAFGSFDAHLRVTLDCVAATDAGESGPVHGVVRNGAAALPLLHLPSLIEGIAQRIKTLGSSQER